LNAGHPSGYFCRGEVNYTSSAPGERKG
jgi:hypothetical protein